MARLSVFSSAMRVEGRRLDTIAHEVGVSTRQLQYWITGQRPVPIAKRDLLADAIGAPVDWAEYDLAMIAAQAQAPLPTVSEHVAPTVAEPDAQTVAEPAAPVSSDLMDWFSQ